MVIFFGNLSSGTFEPKDRRHLLKANFKTDETPI